MTKGYIRPAQGADIATLATNLREADVAEVKAASGLNPVDAITPGIKQGDAYVVCLPDDTPVAIFGVVPMPDEGLGAVWMVATNQFHLLHRQFLRECRREIERLGKGYRALFNFTDARNKVHHRWIKWAGFTIIKRHEKFGHEGRPFLEFVRITEGHHV